MQGKDCQRRTEHGCAPVTVFRETRTTLSSAVPLRARLTTPSCLCSFPSLLAITGSRQLVLRLRAWREVLLTGSLPLSERLELCVHEVVTRTLLQEPSPHST